MDNEPYMPRGSEYSDTLTTPPTAVPDVCVPWPYRRRTVGG